MIRYWQKYRALVIRAIGLILLSSLINVLFGFLKGRILDQASTSFGQSLKWLGALLVVFAIFKAYFFYAFAKDMHYFSVQSIADMREGIFESLLRSTYPRFIQRPAGEIMTLYTDKLSEISQRYFFSFYGTFQIQGALILHTIGIFYIDWQLALAALVLLLPPIFLPYLMKKWIDRTMQGRMQAVTAATARFTQWLEMADVVRNAEATARFTENFAEETEQLRIKSERHIQTASFSHMLAELLTRTSVLLMVALTVRRVAQGHLSAGEFMTLMTLVSEMQSQATWQAGYIQQIMAARLPVSDVLNLIDEKSQHRGEKISAPIKRIEFKNLSFCYTEEREILRYLNFSLEEKGIYLITGPSGGGKSTAMNLLAGYYEPVEGQVMINGEEAQLIENIPELITIMRQDAIFFNDSLRHNLNMYQEVEDSEIIDKMRALGLDKYASVDALNRPMNYSAETFSGGEARRLSLVRSLLKPSEILILDEPLANVDEETIEKIVEQLLGLRDQYVLIVTHQLPDRLKERAIQVIQLS